MTTLGAWVVQGCSLGVNGVVLLFFFFSSRRRHTRCSRDWSSDVCSSDLADCVGRTAGMTVAISTAPLSTERRDKSVLGTRAVVSSQQLMGVFRKRT